MWLMCVILRAVPEDIPVLVYCLPMRETSGYRLATRFSISNRNFSFQFAPQLHTFAALM
jgi:hypothetical protein